MRITFISSNSMAEWASTQRLISMLSKKAKLPNPSLQLSTTYSVRYNWKVFWGNTVDMQQVISVQNRRVLALNTSSHHLLHSSSDWLKLSNFSAQESDNIARAHNALCTDIRTFFASYPKFWMIWHLRMLLTRLKHFALKGLSTRALIQVDMVYAKLRCKVYGGIGSIWQLW